MKVVVSGGAGFIGAHLVAALVERGDHVTVLDNMSTGDPNKIPLGVSIRVGDVRNRWNIENCFFASPPVPIFPPAIPDVIFHLAAIGRTPPCIEKPAECFDVNVAGSVNVLEVARRHGVKRVVMASSNVVYAAPTPYRASKLAMEGWAEAYAAMYGMSIICLRFSNVIGPGLRKGDCAVLSSLRDCRDANGYVEVTGNGNQTRQFTYVGDIVRGCILAAESTYVGTLDLASWEEVSLNVLASYLNCPVKYVPDRKGDVLAIRQETLAAKTILGWEATVPLEEAVRLSLEGHPQ